MVLDASVVPVVWLGGVAVFALVLGGIFSRLGFTSALGYLAAGLVLGAFGLNVLVPGQPLSSFVLELGVLALLFYLGLALDLNAFKKSGMPAAVLSLFEMAAVFAAGFAVSSLLGFPLVVSLVAGGFLSATSTVMAWQFMGRFGLSHWPHARLASDALVFEDVAALALLVFVAAVSVNGGVAWDSAYAVLLFLALFWLVRRVSSWLSSAWNAQDHAIGLVAFALAVGVVSASAFSQLGLFSWLGAYFAGFALACTPAAAFFRERFHSFRELFYVFFFVGVGALASFPDSIWPLFVGLFAAYVLAKVFVFGVMARALGFSPTVSATVGVLLFPLGEFALLLGFAAQGFWPDALGVSVALCIASALLTPLLFDSRPILSRWFSSLPARSGRIEEKLEHLTSPRVKAFQDLFWSSLNRLLLYVVAVGVVLYVAAAFGDQLTLPAFLGLPVEASRVLLVLPFLVWPVFRSLQELRFLASLLVEQLAGPWAVKKAAQAVAGFFMLVAGLLTLGWMHAASVPVLFETVPALYVVFSLLVLSGLFWSGRDYVAPVEGYARGGTLFSKAKRFDQHNALIAELNAERVKSQERIGEALAGKNPAQARKLLSEFRKKEASLLSKLNRFSPRHPFQKKKLSPHLESYFLRSARKKR
ncbi:cation:proton antiporter [Candidatus Micrarchaeota archaeon]|nr:cation:proton antiporter [Candidatus Micrarchaeota archaeon]